MTRFVLVRLVRANDFDLSLFQFDPDLTFAVFFLNADKTIYGRFGSRSDFRESERDISLEGLRKAMRAALEMHDKYPANKKLLAGKTGNEPRFATLKEYPWIKQRGFKSETCLHCHHLGTAEHMLFRSAKEAIPDKVLFPFPMPDVVGLKMDPKEKATILRVAQGSSAAKAGLRAGDEILTLEGQPILSTADVQWVLHNTGNTARLEATILREAKQQDVTLSIEEGWRHRSDIAWRATSGMLRRLAFGGMRFEELPDADRKRAGLADDELALRVRVLYRNATAGRAGFRRGDILVEVEGMSDRVSESELLARILQDETSGSMIPVTVLRGRERVRLKIPVD